MRVRELDDTLVRLLTEADHPEIVSVEALAERRGDGEPPDTDHNRVKVWFASGGTATIMVRTVSGPDIPLHPAFQLPAEVV